MNMQHAVSPLSSPTLHHEFSVSKRSSAQGTRIQIDDNGVHDFDLRKRGEDSGRRRLKKLSRQSTPHQRSFSSLSDMHDRSPSLDSETGSIKKRLSALLSNNKDTLQKSNSGRSTTSIPEPEDDPLPDTKKELEVRLNHHLVELDMLKKTLRAANDVICQHQERYEILAGRQEGDMQNFMKHQKRMVTQARDNRDAYACFVQFHLRQIARIKIKRIEIEVDAGLEPTLPQVYQAMWTEDDWKLMFAV